MVAALALGMALGALTPGIAQADDAGAFVGGMVAGKVLNNMRRRTEAQEYQAYHSSQPQYVQQAPQAAPAAPAQMTQEQKIQQLDKLAAGGYITPEEYKQKKQAILNSL